jgi:hypothetical protein
MKVIFMLSLLAGTVYADNTPQLQYQPFNNPYVNGQQQIADEIARQQEQVRRIQHEQELYNDRARQREEDWHNENTRRFNSNHDWRY